MMNSRKQRTRRSVQWVKKTDVKDVALAVEEKQQGGGSWDVASLGYPEENRAIMEWDDSAAVDALLSNEKPTLQDYRMECDRNSACIDWETRRSCSLWESAEATRADKWRSETRRPSSPVILGLPQPDGYEVHLPLFAVPTPTGWGDEDEQPPQ